MVTAALAAARNAAPAEAPASTRRDAAAPRRRRRFGDLPAADRALVGQRLKRRAGLLPRHRLTGAAGRAGRPDVEPHLRILHRVAEAVSRTLDVEEVLRTAVDALTRVHRPRISSLHLLSEDGKALELRGERECPRACAR